MPELPDVVVYLEALERHVVGQPLEKVRVKGLAVLQTFDPSLSAIEGQIVRGTRRLGKRLILTFDDDLFMVIHLMVAGRLHMRDLGAKHGRIGLLAMDFPEFTLMLTEASKKKRARVWVHRGEKSLMETHDRGGLEPLEATRDEFAERLTETNRTLKRALTGPRIFSGIGNAYSDEILLHAQLSPVRRTGQLSDEEITRLYEATQKTLIEWTDLLREETADGFPKKVTAFRNEMIVHGKFGEPCTVCGKPVQRIVYASNEVNYCAQCQTGGKVLADRSLSRLLKDDWPKSIDELDLD